MNQNQSKALQQDQQADQALCLATALMQVFRAKLITATESADHTQSPKGVCWQPYLAQQHSQYPDDSWAPQQQQGLLLTAISWCNIDQWSTSCVAKDNP